MHSENPNPEFIYKVATRTAWSGAEAKGQFIGMPIDLTDGYMHFSTAGQLSETLSKHFAGQADLVLVAVRTADVAPRLRWEVSRGGALFPHLYEPLSLASVAWTEAIAVAPDGSCALPGAVR